MRGSLRIGTFAGIGVFVHWSFFLLLVWVAWVVGGPVIREHGWTGEALRVAARPFGFATLYVGLVFFCVVLHEFGHALAARRYGVPTRDITLLPIGGVARLERMPEKPGQELAVALAGPAVNLVIAGLLYLVLLALPAPTERLTGGGGLLVPQSLPGFLSLLMVTNVFLLVFNLIPAFPMDGGRVLRALLGYKLSFATATRVAAGVGQVLAVGFLILGLMTGQIFLVFIALFVFLGAGAEAQMAQYRGGLSGIPVRDAMITDFVSLAPEDTLEKASDALLSGSQQDFPVVSGAGFLGVLGRAELVRAIAEQGLQGRVGDVARRECTTATEYDMLYRVFQTMQSTECPTVPVLRAGQVVGLVTLENVGELLMIRSALKQRPGGPRPGRAVPATGQ